MKKRDYILIGCILLIAAVCAGFFLLTGKKAQEAVVTVDGEVYGTYSLAKDQTIEIQDGNRLRIQNGQAKMEWADCPDQLCVHQKAISRTGESIICLPNHYLFKFCNNTFPFSTGFHPSSPAKICASL